MQTLHQPFLDILLQETEAVACLLVVLTREHEVLLRRDTDAIEAVVAEKEEALEQLNRLASQRAALLKQAGCSPDKNGFYAFIGNDESGELAGQWRLLEERLHDCQQQNQLNGMLLESSRQLTEQMLSIIVGRGGEKTELYDQRGASKASFGQNTSIKV